MLLATEMATFPDLMPFFFSSKPTPSLFHSVFCTFMIHGSGLMEDAYDGQLFPFSFKTFTSQNSLLPKCMNHSGSRWRWDIHCSSCVLHWQTWADAPASFQPIYYTDCKQDSYASLHWHQGSYNPFCTSLNREGRKKWRPPHLTPVWEKRAHTQFHFCLSNSPPSCPAGFPFSCAHDFGPPGTEFVLWKENRTQKTPMLTDQWNLMTVSHFLASTCSSDL